MKYNFDEVIDRSGNRAAKYDERRKNFGTDDVIPLWIADMDFRTAQPIIDACKAKAEEGIWGYTSRPDSYFEAYAGWQKRRNGWSIDTSLCSWSLGVVPALAALVKLFHWPQRQGANPASGLPRVLRGDGDGGAPRGGEQHGADRERLGGGLRGL